MDQNLKCMSGCQRLFSIQISILRQWYKQFILGKKLQKVIFRIDHAWLMLEIYTFIFDLYQ